MTMDRANQDKLNLYRQEIARVGIELRPPDVNHGGAEFTVEDGPGGGAIRYALAAIRGVGVQAVDALVAERTAGGRFADIYDLAARAGGRILNRRLLEALIKAGALDRLHANRRQLLAGIDQALRYGAAHVEQAASDQTSLFGGLLEQPELPKPPLPAVEDLPELERLQQEFEVLGCYLTAHPLAGYKASLAKLGVTPSDQLPFCGGLRVKLAGVVLGKQERSTARSRFAFVQLSDPRGRLRGHAVRRAARPRARAARRQRAAAGRGRRPPRRRRRQGPGELGRGPRCGACQRRLAARQPDRDPPARRRRRRRPRRPASAPTATAAPGSASCCRWMAPRRSRSISATPTAWRWSAASTSSAGRACSAWSISEQMQCCVLQQHDRLAVLDRAALDHRERVVDRGLEDLDVLALGMVAAAAARRGPRARSGRRRSRASRSPSPGSCTPRRPGGRPARDSRSPPRSRPGCARPARRRRAGRPASRSGGPDSR